jgi:serine/threonine protein kinase
MAPPNWNRIDDVFQAALGAPASEREHLVDAACADDDETAREVRALLAAHGAATGFLEPLGTAPPIGEAASAGLRVGAYEVVREVGRGGMGAVYLGRRADGQFAQQVAIKIMRGNVVDADATRRFEAERRILAALQHPGIVSLIDGGTTAAGQPYLVTEFIDGEALTAVARARRLPLIERLRVFRKVCDGVHYAHQHSVVHRDLKPANVLVTPDGTVKILDFGVAKLLDPSAPDLTRASAFPAPLTLNYASPEQLRGQPVTTASDVYTLGVLLYELLAGVRPRELEGRPLDDALRDVLEQPTVRPSQAAGRAQGLPYAAASLRGDLDAIALKAMRVEPAARYASADELSRDLARVLNGDPVTAREPSLAYVASRLVRRHRVAATVAAVALAGMLTALGVALAQYRQAEAARADAEARFADVRTLANSLIFRADEAVRTKSPTEARQVIVSDALRYLDRLASASPDPALRLELALGYRRVADIQGGPNAANLGDREGALASARKAAAILEALERDGLEPERTLEALVATYRLLSTVVPSQERPAFAQAAVAAAERRVRVNRSDEARFALASAYFSLAAASGVPTKRDHYEASGREFESLLSERPDDPARMRNVALVDKTLLDLLVAEGALQEADRRAERAVALDSARLALAPNDRQTRLDTAISLAQLATRKNDARERLDLYKRSLAIRELVAAEDPSDRFARVLLRRAVAQVALAQYRVGDLEAARAAAVRTLDLFAREPSKTGLEYRWRAWGHLVLGVADGDSSGAAARCAHLRQAAEDFRAENSLVGVPVDELERLRARLPGCQIAMHGLRPTQ